MKRSNTIPDSVQAVENFNSESVGVKPRNCLYDALTQVKLGAKSEEALGPAGIETTARLSVGLG